jgi:hypothetical protein
MRKEQVRRCRPSSRRQTDIKGVLSQCDSVAVKAIAFLERNQALEPGFVPWDTYRKEVSVSQVDWFARIELKELLWTRNHIG